MRAGLNVMTAFDPGQSMRAGAQILVAAYQRCLRGNEHASPVEQQAALRCAALSSTTPGTNKREFSMVTSADVWRAAAQVVPAIQVRWHRHPSLPGGRPERRGGA